jgi:hypothetical protein
LHALKKPAYMDGQSSRLGTSQPKDMLSAEASVSEGSKDSASQDVTSESEVGDLPSNITGAFLFCNTLVEGEVYEITCSLRQHERNLDEVMLSSSFDWSIHGLEAILREISSVKNQGTITFNIPMVSISAERLKSSAIHLRVQSLNTADQVTFQKEDLSPTEATASEEPLGPPPPPPTPPIAEDPAQVLCKTKKGLWHEKSCWFYGTEGRSCTDICQARNLTYARATATIAGQRAANNQPCAVLMNLLGVSTDSGGNLMNDGFGISNFVPLTSGLGCYYMNRAVLPDFYGRYRDATNATTANASGEGRRRVCACEG